MLALVPSPCVYLNLNMSRLPTVPFGICPVVYDECHVGPRHAELALANAAAAGVVGVRFAVWALYCC